MSDPRHKSPPLPMLVTAVAVFVLVAYPVSLGPAAWLANRPWCPNWFDEGLEVVYFPLQWLAERGPDWLHDALYAYAAWWSK